MGRGTGSDRKIKPLVIFCILKRFVKTKRKLLAGFIILVLSFIALWNKKLPEPQIVCNLCCKNGICSIENHSIMKKLFILLMYIVSQPLLAQDKETRSLDAFTRIELEGRANLYLSFRPDSAPTLEIEVEEGEMQKVKTWVSGHTLHIQYKREEDQVLPVEPKMDLYVNYQQLEAIRVAGIVNIETQEPVQGRNFRLEVEGMGKNYLSLAVEQLQVECSGTADIYLSGSVDMQEIILDGTGTIDAFELISQRTIAEVNGTGSLLVNAEESLEAEANGFGAEIRYRGNPKNKIINKSGFVKVKRDNNP